MVQSLTIVLFICSGKIIIIALKIGVELRRRRREDNLNTGTVVYLKQCNWRTLEVIPYTDLSLGQFFVDTLFAFGEQRFITKKTSSFVMTQHLFDDDSIL